ncbi:MAG: ABC transporter ATP-binding protein [Bacillota bacterium]
MVDEVPPDDIAIATCDLSRSFGEELAVDGLSMEVRSGEVFGFLGHNGAGKTTTVRLLNGVLTPTAGRATVLGLSPVEDGPRLRQHCGVLTETPALDDRLTAREILQTSADLYGVPQEHVEDRILDLTESFDLAGRLDDRVATYSRGMKQRLALARTLLHDPDVLFLDEPTSGLDPVATRFVHDLIDGLARDRGCTIFLCTHNLTEAQNLCDRVAVLERGRVVAMGTPSELIWALAGPTRLSLKIQVPADVELEQVTAPFRIGRDREDLFAEDVPREQIPDLVEDLVRAGVRIYRVAPREMTLEDVYFALHEKRGDRQ